MLRILHNEGVEDEEENEVPGRVPGKGKHGEECSTDLWVVYILLRMLLVKQIVVGGVYLVIVM